MKKTGFTLIETLMALTIFSIGIIGIISMFPKGQRTVGVSLDDFKFMIASDMVYEKVKKDLASDFLIYNNKLGQNQLFVPKFLNHDAGVYVEDITGSPVFIKDVKYSIENIEDVKNENNNKIIGLKQFTLLVKSINENKKKEFVFYVSEK